MIKWTLNEPVSSLQGLLVLQPRWQDVRSLTRRCEQGSGLPRLRQDCQARREAVWTSGQVVRRDSRQGPHTRRGTFWVVFWSLTYLKILLWRRTFLKKISDVSTTGINLFYKFINLQNGFFYQDYCSPSLWLPPRARPW